jgi:RND family efflux transporter MFP subunit
MSTSNKWLKIILPPVVLVGAVLLSVVLVALKPEQERNEPVPIHPKIETFTVQESAEPIVVDSQGTVRPRQQTRLTARVSGHIEAVSADFYEGGSFSDGDILIRLDPLPYRAALAEAEARLAFAEATLIQERETAEQARLDWQGMGKGTDPSPLVLRQPQLMRAESELEAAKVAVEVARKNLDYTEIRAPYAGRVDAKFVDVGQAITGQATVLGEIHSSESFEVPVPFSLDDLSFIEIPKTGSESTTADQNKPTATLTKTINGADHRWNARLDRTAASVDPQSRMITAIVRIDAPFASDHGMELKPGMFVKVSIEGRQVGQVMKVPRNALHPGNVVYRLTPDNRLESAELTILYTDADSAIVSKGLESGDQICLTPLLFFVEGMHVEVVGSDNADQEPGA